MKNHKRVLTLALALVLALGLLPTGALAAMDETVAVEVDPYGDGDLRSIEAFVRIDHALSKETMPCSDGETLDVYTIYPDAKVYRLGFDECTLGGTRWYAASVENGVLQIGEQEGEYFHSEPAYNCWFYVDETEIGKYIVLDILDDHYTKRIGLHVVAGSVPAGTPATYFAEWGLSRKLTVDLPEMDIQTKSWLTEDMGEPVVTRTACKVPAGTTLIPPPYRLSDYWLGVSAYVYRWPLGVLCDEDTAEKVEFFAYQGRQVAVVEPGYVYCCFNDCYYDGFGVDGRYFGSVESGIFLTVDPDVPALEAPAIPASLAYPNTQDIHFVSARTSSGGYRFLPAEINFYALKDEAGNLTNYIKLRDLAALMNGSAAQFQVDWDGSVVLTSGTPYTRVGGEGEKVFFGNQPYTPVTAQTIVNGVPVSLDAFTITDETGGGHTYYKLRDLGQALGFNVGWANDAILVEPNRPYDPND